jgi:DNA-binding SARP family transcriptional activator/TolB-like protein
MASRDGAFPGRDGTGSEAAPVAFGGWRLELLGGCRLRGPDGSDRTPVGRKVRGLLAILALAEGQPVARERLAGLLWADRPEEQARASLRQALRELRRCLDQPGLLRTERDRVALDIRRIVVDALDTGERAGIPTKDGGAREQGPGELLEGLEGLGAAFDAWLAGQRARWRAHALAVLERRLEAAGDPQERQALACRILAIEPAHEPAHRALMLLHARRGDTAAAIRQFETCRDALDRLLDARPSEPTLRLLAQIRAGTVPSAGLAEPIFEEPPATTSLVVMPLREQGGPHDLPSLGEGLAEEISAALARFRWIFVAAPSSAASLARELADPLAIARRLGVRYLVDGRVLHEEGRLRLRVELIEAPSARLLWTDHETIRPAALAELPGGLAAAVAARLARELVLQESARVDPPKTARGEAHLLVLRAARLVYSLDMARLAEAAGLLRRALRIEPTHALAHAWLATVQMLRAGYPWREGHAQLIAEVAAAAGRAVELDPLEALALCTLAQQRVLERRHDEALWLCERAVASNPAMPMAWARRALVFCYRGEPEAALESMARYRRLSPFDPFLALFGRAEVFAHLLAGRFEAAVATARPLIARKPTLLGCYLPMLAALGHLGWREEAAARLVEIYRIEPRLSLEAFQRHYPLLRARDLELYGEGLRRAGLRSRLDEPQSSQGGTEGSGGC